MSVAEDCSDVSNMSMNLNQSMNTSSLDLSSLDSHRRKDVVEKEKAKDEHIAKMIKNSSFESVLSAQKRHAAWESFNEHWALGFKKN
jgi:phage gp16-like protein